MFCYSNLAHIEMMKHSVPQKMTSLHGIKEESNGYGKRAELFKTSMMTPQDRNNGAYEYNILTCSYRPKA